MTEVRRVQTEIRRLVPGDEHRVEQANALFDDPAHGEAARAFLANSANYLLVAYVDEVPAGFVTGHELQGLDDPRPMLFLYELGVDEAYRRRGIGTALVGELGRLARERGCREMFVLTNESNGAAMRTYAAAAGHQSDERDIAMFEWDWSGPPTSA